MSLLLLFTILATVSLSAVAQIAFKAGVSSLQVPHGAGLAELAFTIMSAPLIWVGLIIYGTSLVAWLWVLSKIDVSVAYPFVGLSFVLTAVMGAAFLHEHVSPLRMAGTLLVICGCVLIARSA
jgi:drug/metabolite transporter (DMT)-like permease